VVTGVGNLNNHLLVTVHLQIPSNRTTSHQHSTVPVPSQASEMGASSLQTSDLHFYAFVCHQNVPQQIACCGVKNMSHCQSTYPVPKHTVTGFQAILLITYLLVDATLPSDPMTFKHTRDSCGPKEGIADLCAGHIGWDVTTLPTGQRGK